jgi:hypothetical protein
VKVPIVVSKRTRCAPARAASCDHAGTETPAASSKGRKAREKVENVKDMPAPGLRKNDCADGKRPEAHGPAPDEEGIQPIR